MLKAEYIKQIDHNKYLLYVRLIPNAKQNKIGDIFYDEHKQAYLRVYTTSIPEDNKANISLIKIISKFLTIPKSNILLIKGHKNRQKVLEMVLNN